MKLVGITTGRITSNERRKSMKDEELEGKVIDFNRGDLVKKGLVVGCDREIGITIVDNSDHNSYLLCLTGPSSPLWTSRFPETTENALRLTEHYKIFEYLVDQIKLSRIIVDDLRIILMKITH